MATITSMKKVDSKNMVMEIRINEKEVRHLKGHTDNIHLISDDRTGVPSKVSLRGKNAGTKYFLVPKSLRNGFDMHRNNSSVNCHRITLPDRVLFVYSVSPYQDNSIRERNEIYV